ncbi:MAG: LacI family DNA-binding transcriptional regulator, partial [Anaerolineales bacterium]
KELGYVPDAAAQALASRRSRIIGLILTRDHHHLSSDAYISQILDSLVAAVRKYDMRLLLDIVEEDHSPDAYLGLVQSNRIDGIIFSGPRFDDEALKLLSQQKFPTVLMGQLPGEEFYCVDVDNRQAARKAVKHLIKLGHIKIACITNANKTYSASADRLSGYQDALQEAGIAFDEKFVRFGDFDLESGYAQMKSLLDSALSMTAVFVASDVVAFGAMAAIRERGLRIPQDIAMVGFDDVPLARFVEPYLSTIRLPASELSQRCFDILIQLIQGEQVEPKTILLDTELVIRESCGSNYIRTDPENS